MRVGKKPNAPVKKKKWYKLPFQMSSLFLQKDRDLRSCGTVFSNQADWFDLMKTVPLPLSAFFHPSNFLTISPTTTKAARGKKVHTLLFVTCFCSFGFPSFPVSLGPDFQKDEAPAFKRDTL